MKSYDQLCSVALALDVVGDRWTLLIIRELLITPSRRFSDLRRALPGVAPNLLSQRLRDLESDGVIRRDAGGYGLTPLGRDLEGVVRELMRWGAPRVADAPAEAAFQMHWMSMPARFLTTDHAPSSPPVTVRFGDLADGFDLTADAGAVSVEPCRPDREPDAVVHGPGRTLVGLLQGAVDLPGALAMGVTVEGDDAALRRILPTTADLAEAAGSASAVSGRR